MLGMQKGNVPEGLLLLSPVGLVIDALKLVCATRPWPRNVRAPTG